MDRPSVRYPSALEVGRKAEGETPRRSDGIAGKEAAEIDDIQNVGEILSIGLNPHIQTLRLVNIRARRGIHLEGREYTSAIEVNAVHDLLAIHLGYSGDALGLGFAVRALKVERETCIVLNSRSDPKARSDLITYAAANRVALILRIREMAGGGYHCVVTKKQTARHGKPRVADGVGIAQEARKIDASRGPRASSSAP
jgi:hypothetical protein